MGERLIDLTMISLLGQRVGDLGDIIILIVVVVASVFGSLGKWIAKRLNAKRELETHRRQTTDSLMQRQPALPPLETARALPPRPGRSETEHPPVASPVPPILRRVIQRIPMKPGDASNMERVFEVILERATGVKIERETRPVATPPPLPAPPPLVRSSPQVAVRKRKTQSAAQPAKPISIAERGRRRDEQFEKKRTGAEHESAQMIERQQRFTRDTDQRLGHVETHIEAFGRDDAPGESDSTAGDDLLGRIALRDAIILSEILAPPLALRGELSPSF